MRGVYHASYAISGLAAAKTVMYITSASGKVVEILSASLSNESNETNEQLECKFHRVATLGTPTATTVTAAPTEPGDQAAGSTVKGNVTALEPTYEAEHVKEFGKKGFSSLAGWYFDPLPEERPVIESAGTIGLRMMSTPTAFDALLNIVFREIG